MDPATGISAAQLALDGFKLGREAVESFLGRNEIAKLFREVDRAVRQDSRIPDEQRRELANSVSGLRVDPGVLGALRAYFDDGRADLLPAIQDRIAEIYEGGERDYGLSPAQIAALVVEHIGDQAFLAIKDERRAQH